MKTVKLTILAFMMVIGLNSFAQENEKRFGIELSGGPSFATQKIENATLNTGLGFEGIFHYRFMSYTGIFGGWGWNRFGADDSFAGKDVCFEETGYVLGLQFKYPIGTSPLSFYLRGAGLYNHIEIENAEGDIIKDSGHGFGWQAAGGLNINLGSNWSITPSVKFNSLSRETRFEGVNKSLKLNYISARVGFVKMF